MKYQRGVTSIEYALIAALIAIAIIVGVRDAGLANALNWERVSDAVSEAMNP